MIITDVIPSGDGDEIDYMEYLEHKVLTNYDIDPDFMADLSPEVKNYAIQIYEELVKQVYAYKNGERKEMDNDEYIEYLDQEESVYVELIDENGENVFCQLELGKISDTDFEEYSHYAYFKLHRELKAIKLKKIGEEDFQTNEELMKVFEGLNFISSGSCYDRTLEYSFSDYEPSIDDLLVIREEHRSPKESNEEELDEKPTYKSLRKIIAKREAEIIDRRKRIVEQIDKIKNDEYEEYEEDIDDDDADDDKKYGVVTLKRSYEIIKEMKNHSH